MNNILRDRSLSTGQCLQIVQGDITAETVDAIVNAANSQLRHGGGVAGLISRRGGPLIQSESDQWVKQKGVVTHDKPAYTSAGNLPCRYIIHAVGPVWGSGQEDEKLSVAISSSLRLADQLGIVSISYPAISTGIFGFPKTRAAQVIFKSISDYFKITPISNVKIVRVVLFDEPTLESFLEQF
jgi:O-acetyl-ADP-ribose deacetylase (regulator of RNase III)